MAYGKAIELFLVNGTADSLITAELSNWNWKAIKIPRTEVAACDQDDIKGVGVYFLICQEDDGTDSVYIGEAENVLDRLAQHLRDYQSGKEKYYWNTAVIFVGRDLNKALIRYLENRFVEIAKDCGRYAVLSKNTYKNTVLKEAQIATMEEFKPFRDYELRNVIANQWAAVQKKIDSMSNDEILANDVCFYLKQIQVNR